MTDFSTARRRGRFWDSLLLAAGCVALVAAALAAWQSTSELERRRDEVARLARDADDASQRAKSALSAQGSAAGALAAQAEGTLEAPPPRIVADLSKVMPPDVKLDSLALDYRDRVFVQLRIRARTPEAYDLFLQRLVDSGRFSEIVPGAEARGPELSASLRASYTVETP